ncbi:MAG: hypothetical protein GTN62_03105 [Gemmatimonadales bacterium]|nr:hypothetical protein [Gemmatimonadales bacterium]NIN49088.1 hypothetical protein [Gemmatimonadales bacterium]NIP06552.1 hypothetical protein [Gemmatimonadales bacterium]NIR00249.1 hypothetical protein [Gemmatimonadales bacterium]NIS64582.1 hypothetical protein [Gemmatimonadales bacterium]
MIRGRNAALAATLLLLSGCVVAGPRTAPGPQTLRVRVTAYPPNQLWAGFATQHEGTLIFVDSDTLSLYSDGRHAYTAIPVASITKLEVYRGQKGSVGSAAKGAGVGAAAGALLGAIAGATSAAIFGGLFDYDPDIGEAATEGAVVGAVDGAITGAYLGATVGEAIWQEVTVHQLRQELCRCRIPPAVITTSVTQVNSG